MNLGIAQLGPAQDRSPNVFPPVALDLLAWKAPLGGRDALERGLSGLQRPKARQNAASWDMSTRRDLPFLGRLTRPLRTERRTCNTRPPKSTSRHSSPTASPR